MSPYYDQPGWRQRGPEDVAGALILLACAVVGFVWYVAVSRLHLHNSQCFEIFLDTAILFFGGGLVIAQLAGRRKKREENWPQVNPQDRDYGAIIASRRQAAVENSIDDLYFWSNVMTLILLCALAAVVLLQWRAADKRELIAATLIAQLWNGRVSDRIEIERRTAQFNQLVEAHNAEVERTLSSSARPGAVDEQTTSDLKRTVEGLDKRSAKPGTTVLDKATVPSSTDAVDAQGSEGTSAGLRQRNVILERQVEAQRNTEANLRKRLNETMALLDQEKARNQTLKGA